jgi:hypothetical protein
MAADPEKHFRTSKPTLMTGYEQILDLLKDVNPNTLWGVAIRNVRDRNEQHATMDLVADLQSQSQDNPRLMKEILGPKVYAKILNICL